MEKTFDINFKVIRKVLGYKKTSLASVANLCTKLLVAHKIAKGQKISKKICCPGFFQKTNAGAILCIENCPSVRFLDESRMP